MKSGDIITKMEGLVLATDASMADYCNILRSHTADDVLGIEVLRYETQEVLEGQLNGRPLELAFSFAEEVAESDASEPIEDSGETYSDYVEIYDDSGAIVMQVPATWSDIDGSAWEDEEGILGGALQAAPDLTGFLETYDVPGVTLLAADSLADSEISELLDTFDFSEACTYDGRTDYEDPLYTGAFDLYVDCGDQGAIIAVAAVKPEDKSHGVVIIGQAITEADIDAIDNILNTFNVVGTLPGP